MARNRTAQFVTYCACYMYFATGFLPVLLIRQNHSNINNKYLGNTLSSERQNESCSDVKKTKLSTSVYEYNKRISKLVKTKPSGYLDQCLDILKEIETQNNDLMPDSYTYTSIISAYASKGLARQAEDILHKMEQMGQDNEHIRPNVVTYSSVINAWAKRSARDEEAAANAEALLKRMIKKFDDPSNERRIKPNARCYTSVMDAWARNKSKKYTNGEAARRAEALLNQLKHSNIEGDKSCKPTTFSYAAVISAWANASCHKLSVERAETLLREIEQLYEDTGDHDVQPNSFCYTGVMNAHANLGGKHSLVRCESILNEMVALSQTNPASRPNAYSYRAVMLAYLNSGLRGSTQR